MDDFLHSQLYAEKMKSGPREYFPQPEAAHEVNTREVAAVHEMTTRSQPRVFAAEFRFSNNVW